MNNKEISNYYEHPPTLGSQPKSLLILLHGLGSNGQDLISLAPAWAQNLPDTLFISPDAPFACDMTPPDYPNSFQWFSLQSRDPEAIQEGIEIAAPVLETFIAEQLKRTGISADKLALVGFSQGTMMSLYIAPRLPHKIAGVLGYSGALFGEEELIQNPDEFHQPPIHLIHGEADDVVPVIAHAHATDSLQKAGFEITGHTTQGLSHGIDEHGIQSGGNFLQDILY